MNPNDDLSLSADQANDCESDPATIVYRIIRDLSAGYHRQQATPIPRMPATAGVGDLLRSLTLAEAAIRLTRSGARPPQVAVIGPTQVGKSTVVNLLLGRELAKVSPLAGFTVHPQAFSLAPDASDAWADGIFSGWRRCQAEELRRDDLETFTIQHVDSSGLPPGVFWDTPDFDSLSAEQYQRGVLETAALADLYLLVLSKEKYADLSVWALLRLLQPLGRPLVICLNKLTPDSAQAVTRSLRQRLAEFGSIWRDAPIVPIEYCPELVIESSQSRVLVETVAERLNDRRGSSKAGLCALVERHWEVWTAHVRSEHAAIEEWHQQIDAAMEVFLEHYQRDYLDHPQRFDSFRRAAIELLHLLEIPKLSGWITTARQTVTWPLRQLWAAGRNWRGSGRRDEHDLGAEATVLFDTLETSLTTLSRELTRHCDPAASDFRVWRAISRRLEAEESRLRETFRTALETHHQQVIREIQSAATELYVELKQHPTRLAALRTAPYDY